MIEIFLLPILASLALASSLDEAERARMTATLRAIGLGRSRGAHLDPLVPVTVWPDGDFLARVTFGLRIPRWGKGNEDPHPIISTLDRSDKFRAVFAYVRGRQIAVLFTVTTFDEPGKRWVHDEDENDFIPIPDRLPSRVENRIFLELERMGVPARNMPGTLVLGMQAVVAEDDLVDAIADFRARRPPRTDDERILDWRRAADRLREALESDDEVPARTWEECQAADLLTPVLLSVLLSPAPGQQRDRYIVDVRMGRSGIESRHIDRLDDRPRLVDVDGSASGQSVLDVVEAMGWLVRRSTIERSAGEAIWRFPGPLRPRYEMMSVLGRHTPRPEDPIDVFEVEARDHGLIPTDEEWDETIEQALDAARSGG